MAKGLKQIWEVDASGIIGKLRDLEKNTYEIAEKVATAGIKVVKKDLEPFFEDEHRRSGLTQKGFMRQPEIYNSEFTGVVSAFIGYDRYEGTGFVAAYFERGTPRNAPASQKRVKRYNYMKKAAENPEVANAMAREFKRQMRRYK